MEKQKNIHKALFLSVVLTLIGASVSNISYGHAIEASASTPIGTLSSESTITLTYTVGLPRILTVEDTTYCRIEISGFHLTGQPGDPLLPVIGGRLYIPPGKQISKMEVIGEKKLVADRIQILPVAQPIPLSESFHAKEVKPNPLIYTSENPFPEKNVILTGRYGFRGNTIQVFRVSPVQYIPAENTLYYYPKMTVIFTLSDSINDDSFHLLSRDISDDTLSVMSMVENPSDVEKFRSQHSNFGIFDATKSYQLLLITTDELRTGFARLVAAHTLDGLRTTVQTLGTDIPIGSTVEQTCENIRNTIRQAYLNDGVEYVLIGGDIDVIPAAMLYAEANDTYPAQGNTTYETTMPSDIYYACLDGPYNNDGDDQWGEPTDGETGGDVDLLAEVCVGRACVGNITEVGNFVNKTLSYMLRDAHNEYLRQIVMLGEWMGGPPAYPITFSDDCMEELITGSSEFNTVGIPHDEYSMYNFTRLYDSTWPGFDPEHPYSNRWEAEDLAPLINRGTHFIHHMGHSGPFYNMRLCLSQYTNDLALLQNEKYCFVYSQGCDAGGFDRDICQNPPIPDCMAEYLTVKLPVGAFAGIWNARYGWYLPNDTDGPSQRYHREFVDALYGEQISSLCKANQDSKEDNLYRINEECMRWCYYELNYFGDPSVEYHQLNPVHNIGVVNMTVPALVQPRAVTTASVILVNSGQSDETNVNVNLFLNETFVESVSIPFFVHHSIQRLNFTIVTGSAGIYILRVTGTIPDETEEFMSDNTKQGMISVGVQNTNTMKLYNTIQQALNDPLTISGHSIQVPKGIYRENIVITKNVNIFGENDDSTILIGKSVSVSPSILDSPTVTFLQTSSATLSGFTITREHQFSSNEEVSVKRSGVGISLISTTQVSITNNIITNSQWGIYCTRTSTGNHIFHNAFFINNQHAYDLGENVWDNGYPSGGNYWDSYRGSDLYSGLHQDEPGSDGIGDVPYFFKNGVDRYPLMKPLV